LEIAASAEGHHALVAVRVPLGASLGVCSQDEHPARANHLGQIAEQLERDDLPREVVEWSFLQLAFDGGDAVGTVTAFPEDERIYIRSMAVRPNAQGTGVGQALLETLESDARERGFEKLYLYTTFVLPGAQPLYEKNGFVVTRETAPEEWHDMGGIEMEKILE